MGKLAKVCSGCGGENVRADGTIVWDIEEQKWVVGMLWESTDGGFDPWCDDCESPMDINTIEVLA